MVGDGNDEDLVTTHHVERCEGELFENDSARAMFRGKVPVRRYAYALNDSSQFLQEAGSGKMLRSSYQACAR